MQGKQAAAKYLELILKTTPWALTDNYVSRERENRGSQVAFAGPGDPTGKGRGFSFVKDTRKVHTVPKRYVSDKHFSCERQCKKHTIRSSKFVQ